MTADLSPEDRERLVPLAAEAETQVSELLTETEVEALRRPCKCGHEPDDHGTLTGCHLCANESAGERWCMASFLDLLNERLAAIVAKREADAEARLFSANLTAAVEKADAVKHLLDALESATQRADDAEARVQRVVEAVEAECPPCWCGSLPPRALLDGGKCGACKVRAAMQAAQTPRQEGSEGPLGRERGSEVPEGHGVAGRASDGRTGPPAFKPCPGCEEDA